MPSPAGAKAVLIPEFRPLGPERNGTERILVAFRFRSVPEARYMYLSLSRSLISPSTLAPRPHAYHLRCLCVYQCTDRRVTRSPILSLNTWTHYLALNTWTPSLAHPRTRPLARSPARPDLTCTQRTHAVDPASEIEVGLLGFRAFWVTSTHSVVLWHAHGSACCGAYGERYKLAKH